MGKPDQILLASFQQSSRPTSFGISSFFSFFHWISYALLLVGCFFFAFVFFGCCCLVWFFNYSFTKHFSSLFFGYQPLAEYIIKKDIWFPVVFPFFLMRDTFGCGEVVSKGEGNTDVMADGNGYLFPSFFLSFFRTFCAMPCANSKRHYAEGIKYTSVHTQTNTRIHI